MGKTVAKIIGYTVAALLLIAIVVLIYRFTNGFNEDFKTFYIEYDGKQILAADSKMTFENGKTYLFSVKYTFDTANAEPKDYSVKIVPHIEQDFDYTVDDEQYRFSKVGELTSCFALTKSDTSFKLEMPEKLTLQNVLSNLHGGKAISLSAEAEEKNPFPYCLVISSYNGKITYNINFNVTGKNVTGVKLNPPEIIFGSS